MRAGVAHASDVDADFWRMKGRKKSALCRKCFDSEKGLFPFDPPFPTCPSAPNASDPFFPIPNASDLLFPIPKASDPLFPIPNASDPLFPIPKAPDPLFPIPNASDPLFPIPNESSAPTCKMHGCEWESVPKPDSRAIKECICRCMSDKCVGVVGIAGCESCARSCICAWLLVRYESAPCAPGAFDVLIVYVLLPGAMKSSLLALPFFYSSCCGCVQLGMIDEPA